MLGRVREEPCRLDSQVRRGERKSKTVERKKRGGRAWSHTPRELRAYKTRVPAACDANIVRGRDAKGTTKTK